MEFQRPNDITLKGKVMIHVTLTKNGQIIEGSKKIEWPCVPRVGETMIISDSPEGTFRVENVTWNKNGDALSVFVDLGEWKGK